MVAGGLSKTPLFFCNSVTLYLKRGFNTDIEIPSLCSTKTMLSSADITFEKAEILS
jgi:hypothetical protein